MATVGLTGRNAQAGNTAGPDPLHYLDIRDGHFDAGDTQLDRSFAQLAKEFGDTPSDKPLVLHFHGGLRTKRQALPRAALGE
jgi:hypothetical protein